MNRSIEFAAISEAGLTGIPPDMKDFTYFRANEILKATLNCNKKDIIKNYLNTA